MVYLQMGLDIWEVYSLIHPIVQPLVEWMTAHPAEWRVDGFSDRLANWKEENQPTRTEQAQSHQKSL